MAIISSIKQLLPKNSFVRSVSVLAGGTAVGQAIVVLASPLLTRMYSPEDFGLLAVYSSLLMIFGVVSSLRYQLAIPLPEEDKIAAHVVVLCIIVVLVMSILSAFIVFFFNDPIAVVLNMPELSHYLWLLPIGLFFMGIYQVFNFWAIRIKAFPAIVRTKLTQSLGMVGVQLVCYVLGPVALLLGHVVGKATGLTNLGVLTIWKNRDLFREVHLSSVLKAAWRYRRFPIYSTWGAVFNTTSTQLPPLLFAALFNSTVAGFYMLAHRVLAIPMALVGGAIGDVFFSNAADARRDGTLPQLVATIHDKLAHIAMPPSLLLTLAGPELFVSVFGTEWKTAGNFAQLMAPWIYFAFITSPLSMLFPVLEKQSHEVVFQAVLFVTRISALIYGALFWDITITICLFSFASIMCYLAVLVWEVRISGNSWSVIWNSSLNAFLISTILLSPLIVVQIIDTNTIIWFGALLVSAILVVCRYFYLFKKM